ncbi:MAG TPA: allophanate hydrolase subunit 1 [Aeromicrobium sp.]|nr:allophanate hydrolase subunit 1 [Aeromicrobium sp.]
MRVLPCGDRAVLLDCASLDEARRWHAALRDEADVTLGARTVLVHGDPAASRALVARTRPQELEHTVGELVEIPVVYDGDDLDDVARLTGLTPSEVVEAHTGRPWIATFAGFAPGFVYLSGGDPRLDVPRRSTPRTRVPAGSVGLAGTLSGVYPRPSPGGWQLIGRTYVPMWDLDADPPARLRPGARVQFVEARR